MRMLLLLIALGQFGGWNREEHAAIPLRKLVHDAELVAVAQVHAIESDPALEGIDIVTLLVSETLKGTVTERVRVQTASEAALLCPEPPRFETGTTVLCFLRQENGFHHVIFGKQGLRKLQEKRLDARLRATRELIRISRLEKNADRREALIEWLLRGLESPELALDVLLDSAMPRMDEGVTQPAVGDWRQGVENWAGLLEGEKTKRALDAWLRLEFDSWYAGDFLKRLAPGPDPRVDRKLIEQLEREDLRRHLYSVSLLRLLADRRPVGSEARKICERMMAARDAAGRQRLWPPGLRDLRRLLALGDPRNR